MPKRTPKPAPAFTLQPGESITFVLPVVPRTKKNHGQVVQRGTRKFHVSSDAYQEMEAKIKSFSCSLGGYVLHRSHLVLLASFRLAQPLNCCAIFYRDADRGDAVGYYQGLADCLEAAGVVSDDKWIAQWDGSRLTKDANRPRIEVVLTAL